MDYTGNGIQICFLKEVELFIYYVKGPLRGLLQEIPENHPFSPWIGNTCFQGSNSKTEKNCKSFFIQQLTICKKIFLTLFLLITLTAPHHLTQ